MKILKLILVSSLWMLMACTHMPVNYNSYNYYRFNFKKDTSYSFYFGKLNSFPNINKVKFFVIDDSLMIGFNIYPFNEIYIYNMFSGKKKYEIKPISYLSSYILDYKFFSKDSIVYFASDNYRYSYDSSFVFFNIITGKYKIEKISDKFLINKENIPEIYNLSKDGLEKKYLKDNKFRFIDNLFVLEDKNLLIYFYRFNDYTSLPQIKGCIYDFSTNKSHYIKYELPHHLKKEDVLDGYKWVGFYRNLHDNVAYIYFPFAPDVYKVNLATAEITDTIKLCSQFFHDYIYIPKENRDSIELIHGGAYGPLYKYKNYIVRNIIYKPQGTKGISISNLYDVFFNKKGEAIFKRPENEKGKELNFYNNKAFFSYFDGDSIKVDVYKMHLQPLSKSMYFNMVDSLLQLDNSEGKELETVCQIDGLFQKQNGGWNFLRKKIPGEKNYVAIILSSEGCHTCNDLVLKNIVVNQVVLFSKTWKKKFYLIYVASGLNKKNVKNTLKEIGIPVENREVIIDTTNSYVLQYNKSITQNPRLVVVDSLGKLKIDSVYEVGNQPAMIMDVFNNLSQ